MNDFDNEFETVEPKPQQSHWSSPQFRKRVISAIILGPLVLVSAAFGGLPFYTLIILMAIFMMREWDMLNAHRESTAWGVAGVLYVTLTCLSLIRLREEVLGGSLSLLLLLIAVVWATDIGAYFSGKQIGGLKLAPKISPNKTWAGLLGGILCAMIIASILCLFFPFPTSIGQAACIGALLAIVAQLGDLFESWMKREAGMKDSSNLIPGHGGMLDRVDGITFTAPLLVIIHIWLTHAAGV